MKPTLLFSAIAGLTAVLAGALGMHLFHLVPGSKPFLVYETAIRYQMWHAIVLLAIGFYRLSNAQAAQSKPLWIASTLFIIGIIGFCGGIYIQVIGGSTALNFIIPIGGTLLMIAWLVLFIYGLNVQSKASD